MRTYIINRLLQIVPVTIIVTFLVHALMWTVPGDPVYAFIGIEASLDEEQLDILRKKHHLDQPIIIQYFFWFKDVLHGEFSRSTTNGMKVFDELSMRAPVTFQLGICAFLFAVIVSVPAGIISAVYRGRGPDHLATFFSIGAVAIPDFWLGIIGILLFGVSLGWLPTQGYVNPFENPIEGLRHMILPAFALGCTSCALIMRQTRSAMLEVLAQDYIRTARSKGLFEARIVLVHALRNSLLPVVTILGLQTGRIFASAIVVETLFGMPGIGQFMVEGVFGRDFKVVQGSVLLMASMVLVCNLVTDILYAWLDPRIKYDG
jgi:peptide/nickel transport system permease protein